MSEEILKIKLPAGISFLGDLAELIKKYFDDARFFESKGYLVICGQKKKIMDEDLFENA